jgi:hypothetical protein
VAAALAAVLAAAAVPPAAAAAELAVRYEDGRLSVRAERVALGRVLEAVARAAGVEVAGVAGPGPEVTLAFDGLSLLDGVRRAMGTASYAIFLEDAPGRGLTRIEIRLAGLAPDPAAGPAPVPLPPDTRAAARRAAVERLGARGAEEAIPHILAALDDASPAVRRAAVASLPQYGETGLEPLHRVLRQEGDVSVRLAALQVLAQVRGGTEHTVALLGELLGDPDARIRAAAVPALARAGGARAAEALHLAAEDAAPDVRIAALEALALRARDTASAAVLARHVEDPDAAVRGVARALLAAPGE